MSIFGKLFGSTKPVKQKHKLYVSYRFNKATENKIKAYAKQIGVKNVLDDIHLTLINTVADKSDIDVSTLQQRFDKVKDVKLEPFKYRPYKREGKNGLLLDVKCPTCTKLHTKLYKEFAHKKSWKFEPHISLSRDTGTKKFKSLPKFDIKTNRVKVQLQTV